MNERQTQREIEAKLIDFTKRETSLLAKVKEKGLTLPERLADWQTWIQDSQIYLNELKNFVDTH